MGGFLFRIIMEFIHLIMQIFEKGGIFIDIKFLYSILKIYNRKTLVSRLEIQVFLNIIFQSNKRVNALFFHFHK